MNTENTAYKPKNLRLKAIPEDVYDMLLDEQSQQKKAHKTSQFNLEKVIYILIRKSKNGKVSNEKS